MAKNNGKSVQTSIRLPVEIWGQVDKQAKEEGRSFTNMLIRMIHKARGKKAS